MMGRRFIGRGGPNHRSVVSRTRPEHHADGHGIGQPGLDVTCDLQIVLLVRRECVLLVVDDLGVTGGYFHLWPAQQRCEGGTATDRGTAVDFRLSRTCLLYTS